MTDRKGVSYKKTVDKEQFFLAVENFHDNYRDFYNAYQKHEANNQNNQNRSQEKGK
jgi:hypothetical protein